MAANAKKDFKRILLPTDFSDASEKAASYALSLARSYGAKLHVLHVVDLTDEPSGFYVPHLSYEKLNEEMKASAEKMLKRFTGRVFKGIKDIETHVVAGEPYKEIIRLVKDADIDVVVVGSSGKSGVDRFLFGSTAERVMRKLDRPVLVVPPEA
ncbi:MAG TPA: universal stress protein [Thermodesulfobacteriota bacterium]|nr:universal stress protein [Thermodesulfobacteriota bacterium]